MSDDKTTDPLEGLPADVKAQIVDSARAHWRGEGAYQREIASEAAADRARQSARVKHRNNIFDRGRCPS